jgi:hypothetical protein
MKSFAITGLCAACLSVGCWVLLPTSAFADYGARPNSTDVTFFDWDHDRIDMNLSDQNLVLNVELRRQNGPNSEYFMGEYNEYRVMYDRESHTVTVINYVNGKELYNYNFYEVDSQVDEGYL